MNIFSGIRGLRPADNHPQGMDNIPVKTGGFLTGGPLKVRFDIFGQRRTTGNL